MTTNILEDLNEVGLDPIITEMIENPTSNEEDIRYKKIWTVDDLLSTEFPEPKWAIPDLIPEGLTILGGRPKKGKSFLSLQMAQAIATGGMFFNHEVEQGEVLFYALEDNPRRIKDRLIKMGVKPGTKITFLHEIKPLHEGGISELYENIVIDRYRYIVVDTLAKASRGIDQNKQAIMSRVWSEIQTTAINHNSPLQFIDHTRKPMGINADPIDDIMASTIKTGAADAILAIYSEQGKAGSRLMGRGRDISDIDLRIHWDPITFCFQCDGDSNEIRLSEAKQDIHDVVKSLGRSQLGDISKAVGKDRSYVFRVLSDLFTEGFINRFNIGNNVYYENIQKINNNDKQG